MQQGCCGLSWGMHFGRLDLYQYTLQTFKLGIASNLIAYHNVSRNQNNYDEPKGLLMFIVCSKNIYIYIYTYFSIYIYISFILIEHILICKTTQTINE